MIIYIPIQPRGAPRPRVTKFGTYNAKDYTEYKNVIGLAAKTKIKTPLETSVAIDIEFFFEIPKSWGKKKKDDSAEDSADKTAKPAKKAAAKKAPAKKTATKKKAAPAKKAAPKKKA